MICHLQKSLGTALFGLLIVGACSHGDQEPGERGTMAMDVEAKILQLDFSGSLCPTGTPSMNDPSAPAAGLAVGQDLFGDNKATCKMVFEMEIPAGYQGGVVGYTGFSTEGGKATLTRRYSFQGGMAKTFSTKFTANDSLDLVEKMDRPELYSKTCEGDTSKAKRVKLEVEIEVTTEASPTEGLFTFETFALETNHGMGAPWKTCNGGSISSAKKGEPCAGPAKMPCAEGLVCDMYPDSSEGECVDPDEKLPPQDHRKHCGGHRKVLCREGLVCWWPSEASRARQEVGICCSDPPVERDPCNSGVPKLKCTGQDMFCYATESHSPHCVKATGKCTSVCGEGLPACEEPLVCSMICTRPNVGEGEACGAAAGGDLNCPVRCSLHPTKLECKQGKCVKAGE
jgi:hypothetical protein